MTKPILAITRTVETPTAVGMLALDNIEAVLAGKPAPTFVKR